MPRQLSKTSKFLISAIEERRHINNEETISVNPVVSELASWYEKFRTAMDYRDDEVILRSAIERILKRRLILGGNGSSIAAPLLRELVWARYFPDASLPESRVIKVSQTIDLFLELEKKINEKHKISEGKVNEWIIHLLSSEIEDILKPGNEKDLMCNFIFQLLKEKITITDDSEETRDIQIFIAVRRAYANDDLAFLRFRLFRQFFGKATPEKVDKIAERFLTAKNKFEEQFSYPLKDKIYNFVKNQTIPFLILDDVLRENIGKIQSLVMDEDRLNMAVLNACNRRYNTVSGKVRRAIVRSVIFIFVTKAALALFVEGSVERVLYGRVIWSSIILNTITPPILMILVGLSIKTPARDNSYRVLSKINTILFDENPKLAEPLVLQKKPKRIDPILWFLFMLFWLLTFALSFGAIIFILSKFKVNPISQGIFVFFLAIVSFVSYRINKTAHMYILKTEKDSWTSIAFDFFFMPFIQVGRKLTSAVSQLNIILFIFDFIIEAPFKGIVAFFEQWLLFLRTQREKLE
ncbi:hypothetical protein A3C59_03050 [Candidatus Daviesbacteria bacterium RIFCSPHIGHO2_02_FULL_36_13]|uniref:Uncharacterized protein n=1 Tax=Candidatus Daviesbacteria bacterium RIFCSPHIGHO2_02_FULL_36_13 TaxID=1797768 RepID=A0A1F5JQ01_9BACT|nr:MAG: hypothetical protein A3C59_03050 [Candidatus Daviesbacteria bacterium RIFCSPHIGHO2_02_FULL_36_13]